MQDSDTYLLSSQLEIKYDVNSTAEKEPGIPFNLVVCRRMLHGKVDATLAVHLGPNLLGAGVHFLKSE